MSVDHVALPRRDLQRQDLAGQLGREREQARAADRRVLGHEKRASRHGAAERAHEATLLAAGRGRGLHLHRHRQPRHLARFREDLLIGLHVQLEDGHHRADDLRFHGCDYPSPT
jgi:hypothetical protein